MARSESCKVNVLDTFTGNILYKNISLNQVAEKFQVSYQIDAKAKNMGRLIKKQYPVGCC